MTDRCVVAMLFLFPMVGLSAQTTETSQQNIVVVESRLGLTCDTFTNRCTLTQHLVAKVGEHKLELRRYESKPEALLNIGTYSAKQVEGKSTSSYRLNESYIFTYPDGRSEKFDVIGILS